MISFYWNDVLQQTRQDFFNPDSYYGSVVTVVSQTGTGKIGLTANCKSGGVGAEVLFEDITLTLMT